jgi:hypothetical protein
MILSSWYPVVGIQTEEQKELRRIALEDRFEEPH